jgi:hypothetical protein
MHRHRQFRLDNLRQHRIDTKAANRPAKKKAAERRDVRLAAKAKATPAGVQMAPEVQSWISRIAGRPYSKLSQAEIAAAIG